MKLRFSSLDVSAMGHELSEALVGMRLQNIYDLSSRIFLFKFQKPDRKEQFIIDTGFRCHLTSFGRTTASEPSVFVRRLRKLLGTRRITLISQVGSDRVIDIQFSEGLYHLYLEFFAAGNIVVTDKDLNILALFRNVNEGPDHEQIKIGEVYKLSNFRITPSPEITAQLLKTKLEELAESTKIDVSQKKNKKKTSGLKRDLAQIFREWPSILLDEALLSTKFDSTISTDVVIANNNLLDQLVQSMQHAQNVQTSLKTAEIIPSFIIAKKTTSVKNTDTMADTTAPATPVTTTPASTTLLYDDFQPFEPKQFESNDTVSIIKFDSFNKAVDEFYSSIEGQKLDSRLHEREVNARKKLEDTKKFHHDRIDTLKNAQSLNVQKAEAIEANVERVQEAMDAVNGLIAQSMDWADIAKLIEQEQKRGNPVAQIIKMPLKLYENTITLKLSPPGAIEDENYKDESDTEESDSDSEDQHSPPSTNFLSVDIDLSLSPWANATQFYDQKRTAAEKEKRTAEVSNEVIKNAERKVNADLKKGLAQEKDSLRPLRQLYWFEKFHYFISSDGYLVVAAKDPMQADLIYKKYLKKGDVYTHAEIPGSLITIVKNNLATPDAPIPPSTLSQAGTFSVCASTAWDSKALLPAWWVNASQVSKMSPQGEFLGPGMFHISGTKNYLPPAQLLVGIGVVFQISEESTANHNKHRIFHQSDIIESTENMKIEDSNADTLSKVEVDKMSNDSDDSEDFPDAAPVTLNDSDDEDFPDVDPLKAQDSDDEHENSLPSNPLQPRSTSNHFQVSNATLETDENDTVSIADSSTDTNTLSKPGHRYVTAKERRQIKKGAASHSSIESAPQTPKDTDVNQDEDDEDVQSNADSVTTTLTNNTKSNSGQPLPRGKRTKAKKAAAKYANQDEEDRLAALQRIGAQTGNKRKEAEAEERRKKEQAEAEAKQRRREQHLRKQAIGRSAEERRQAEFAAGSGPSIEPATGANDTNNDANIINITAEDDLSTILSGLQILPTLVGKLHPSDTLITAWPICAPWTALARYKYKVKLQPGSMKKGKAAREVLNRWQEACKTPKALDPRSLDDERIWPGEAELIKAFRDTEVMSVVPVGKVKIVLEGGSAGARSKGGGGGGGGKGSGQKGAGGKGKGGKKK